MDNFKNKIMEYISKNYWISSDEISDDESLIDTGILTSVGLMQLIQFIESEFNIEMNTSEIVPENFGSVSSIINYISMKKRTNQ